MLSLKIINFMSSFFKKKKQSCRYKILGVMKSLASGDLNYLGSGALIIFLRHLEKDPFFSKRLCCYFQTTFWEGSEFLLVFSRWFEGLRNEYAKLKHIGRVPKSSAASIIWMLICFTYTYSIYDFLTKKSCSSFK